MPLDYILDIDVDIWGADKYPAKSHVRRVAEKLQADDGLLVLAATKARNWPNSDMPAPFRQDRYFYYMTGCNESDCFVTYHIKTDTLTLWLPPINESRVLWYGRGSTVEEALESYDIDQARYIDEKSLKVTSGGVHGPFWYNIECLVETGPQFDDWYDTWACRTRDEDRQHLFYGATTISSNDLYHAIDACRVIKDEHEIDLIRRANVITGEAHVNVMKGIHKFEGEPEVEAAYMQVCTKRKAKEQAYDVIAGSGRNAAELHYSKNLDDFYDGQTLVLDAGCEVERYASDVTRTLPINKKKPGHWPSKEAAQIYALVEEIQEACIKDMLPGNIPLQTFWLAHKMVVEGLLKLGILKGGSVEEIFAAGTSQAFLPHGLGHHVGLEVHDVSPLPHPPVQRGTSIDKNYPWRPRVREAFLAWQPQWELLVLNHDWFDLMARSNLYADAQVLEPGMVVTVEPGIYFNKFLLKNFFLNKKQHRKYIDIHVLNRYMQVGGVRIEDDILITKDGYENLTTAPKGEQMLKVIRESAKVARA